MSQDENLKQISERCVKQDPTFKIMLNPKQLLIGNYSLKLKALKPLIFEQNSNRRICMRFYVEGNPKVGYNYQDIGIALTQFDSITVKDEERENPAVLTCSLKPTSMTKFYKMLTGVQEIVEKPFPHRKNLTRNFTFTLHPFQKNTENYSKVSFGALDTFREFQLDFEAVKKILLQDLHGVWNEMLRDQAARRPNISIGHTHKLMAEMDSSSWIQYIQDQKLQKQLGPDGSVIYTSMPETPGGRILHTGSKEYAGNAKRLQPFIDFEQNEKRKKMKVVPSHIKKGDFAYTNTNVKLAQQPQQSLKKFEVASSSSESPTPSSRKASSAQQAAKLENESSWVSSETQLFSFPPRELVLQGIDPVAFMVRDVRTLDRKEFVNDNVMAFMLNYIAVNMIDKELMNKIHLCNTFFYSNLTRSLPTLCFSRRKPIEAEHNVTLVENCSRVLRWTKKFDVFSKDYIVIPVNEDYHWLLITVFNPAGAIVNLSSEDESRKAPMCYVAFFDPLSGLDPTKKNHMCYCVKTYLAELYDKTKTAGKRFASADNTAFDPDRVIITNPKNLPIQSNFYDCGLYTLHFIEGLFCYLNRPVTVKDFPNFDWSALYPAANEMADLMRDKIYNLVLKVSDQRAKQRLSRYEKNQSTGLSQEGNLRKGRRHSADRVRKTPRHGEYRQRRYSVNPPSRAVMEDPMFLNPRAMVEMPATRRVRALRLPEENFPVIY